MCDLGVGVWDARCPTASETCTVNKRSDTRIIGYSIEMTSPLLDKIRRCLEEHLKSCQPKATKL